MIVQSKFSPPPGLRNPHVQTVLASKWVRPAPVQCLPQRVELDDGDFIDLAHTPDTGGPIVCLFHGLAGCIESSYAAGAMARLTAAGYTVVFMHWRGCSGEPNRLPIAYHSGATSDIRWLVNRLQQHYPDRHLHALGFSLGGNALLKYLGEEQSATPLSSALAVCPPLMLDVGADTMNRGLARGYQRYLVTLMRRQHEAKRTTYPELELPVADASLNSFWAFDDAITAPLHGFDDVHDYYARCSARQFLQHIRVPTHVLCAADDPFFTDKVIPARQELGPSVRLEVSHHGGHVGFLDGLSDQHGRWLDRRIVEVFSEHR